MSPNDEPRHWQAVTRLHKSCYFAQNLGPFVIPTPTRHALASPKKHARGESSPAKGETKSDGSVNGVGRVMQLDEAMQIEDMEPKTPSSCGSSTQGSPSSVSSSSSRRGRQVSVCPKKHAYNAADESQHIVTDTTATSEQAAHARSHSEYLPNIPQTLYASCRPI